MGAANTALLLTAASAAPASAAPVYKGNPWAAGGWGAQNNGAVGTAVGGSGTGWELPPAFTPTLADTDASPAAAGPQAAGAWGGGGHQWPVAAGAHQWPAAPGGARAAPSDAATAYVAVKPAVGAGEIGYGQAPATDGADLLPGYMPRGEPVDKSADFAETNPTVAAVGRGIGGLFRG